MKLRVLCLAQNRHISSRNVIRYTSLEHYTNTWHVHSFPDTTSLELQPCADLRQFERGSLAETPSLTFGVNSRSQTNLLLHIQLLQLTLDHAIAVHRRTVTNGTVYLLWHHGRHRGSQVPTRIPRRRLPTARPVRRTRPRKDRDRMDSLLEVFAKQSGLI